MKRLNYLFLIVFILFGKKIFSQNINGSWEGISSGGEFLQINLVKNGNELCGYTYDYELTMPSSFCRANLRGYYDTDKKAWVIVGTSFIQNNGSHVLMYITLSRNSNDPSNTLRGTKDTKSAAFSMFNMGESRDRVLLKRVSSKPAKISGEAFVCPEDRPKRPKPSVIKDTLKKTAPPVVRITPKIAKPVATPTPKKVTPPISKKENVKPASPVYPGMYKDEPTKIDTVSKIKIVPKAESKDAATSLLDMQARKKTEFSRIVVHDKNITLKVYDNGIIDNDSVSIFYNGRILVLKKKLSEEPLVINLQLDEGKTIHEIVMFAENLGSISPNTALIVVTTPDNRYELHSSASLIENAVLTFEYRPK